MKRLLTPLVVVPLAVVLSGCELIFPPPDPPDAPRALAAEPVSRTRVELSWAEPETGEVGRYELERASAGGTFERVARPGAGATSYADDGLSASRAYVYRLRACNDGGCSGYTREVEIETFGDLSVATTSVPDAAVGQPYTTALEATGAGTDYTWAIVAGALPDGLVLTDTSGVISGTPSAEDTAQFTVEATSTDGQTATAALTLRVLQALPITIETYVLPPNIVGGDYDVHLEASGGSQDRVWSLVSGTLPPGLALEDSTGIIAGTATATDTATVTLRVESFGESDERTFDLVVVAHDTTGYDITPLKVASIPDSIQPHVDSAVARWERAIIGNVEAGYIEAGAFEPDHCGGFGDAVNGTTLDDIIVMINISSIDGPGGTLAQAGPCAIRSSESTDPNIPAFGLVTLDQDDIAPLVGTETLTATIFHEIGHVLGYGALWSHLGLVEGEDTNAPTFIGSGAVGEWQDLGGSGNVPLENDGGDGTAEVHWEEDDFGTEVMTGFSEPVGTPQPLSRVSIASMEDLGYQGDREEADAFALASSLAAAGADHLGFDRVIVPDPIFVLDPDGTVRLEPLR